MKKIFFIIIFSLLCTSLNAETEFKFYAKKALDNNLQLKAERKNLDWLNKIEIYQEVNFYPVLLSRESK